MSTRILSFQRLLAAPGREAALRDAVVEVEDGCIRSVESGAAANERIAAEDLLALPAMVNAHDHGYGLRPLALGGADDALECWIASLTGRPTIDPWLETAIAFGRMAHSGIGATVHCHNSLAADRLADEAAEVARAAADIGIRVAFSCPILDRKRLRLRRPGCAASAPRPGGPGAAHGSHVPRRSHRAPGGPGRGDRGRVRERAVPGAVRSDRAAVVRGLDPGTDRPCLGGS